MNFSQKLNKVKLDYLNQKKRYNKKKLKENFKTIYSIYKFKGNRPNFSHLIYTLIKIMILK